MTELEKLDAGLEYDFWDNGVNSRKLRAIELCGRLNAMSMTDEAARESLIRERFGSCLLRQEIILQSAPSSTAITVSISVLGKTSSPTTMSLFWISCR